MSSHKGNFNKIFKEKSCHICNKKIVIFGVDWGYVINNKYFCTYGCMREYERKKKEKLNEKWKQRKKRSK